VMLDPTFNTNPFSAKFSILIISIPKLMSQTDHINVQLNLQAKTTIQAVPVLNLG